MVDYPIHYPVRIYGLNKVNALYCANCGLFTNHYLIQDGWHCKRCDTRCRIEDRGSMLLRAYCLACCGYRVHFWVNDVWKCPSCGRTGTVILEEKEEKTKKTKKITKQNFEDTKRFLFNDNYRKIDCCWELPLDNKTLRHNCNLMKKECMQAKYEDCPRFKRVNDIVKRGMASRPYLKNLSRKDRDYLKYAFYKFVSTQNELELAVLRNELSKFTAKILTQDCRQDKKCPYKALLPEYDVT